MRMDGLPVKAKETIMPIKKAAVKKPVVKKSAVTGKVKIAGTIYAYKNGMLKFAGAKYAVSDDGDFVISSKKIPIGAIINGVLMPLDKLNAKQQNYFANKYGYKPTL